MNFVIQVNGKKRGLIKANRDINEEEVLKQIQNDFTLSKYITDKKIKKKIFIKNKIINLII